MSATIPDQLPPARRRSSIIVIVSAIMAVFVIIAGVVSLFIYHTNQVAQNNIHATATVVQRLADNHATATQVGLENAVDTAVAIPGLTATAVAISPYAPFTTVLLDDSLTSGYYKWSEGSNCQMSGEGYQISVTRDQYIQYCTDDKRQYGEMAYQVTMSIQRGDCGGLVFGFNDMNNYYLFEVCQNGIYNVYSRLRGGWIPLYPYFHTSTEIRRGSGVQNRIAVTTKGKTINTYVNGKQIDTVTDLDVTLAPIRNGQIGLFAEDRGNPTSVIYTNALVWTM